MESHNQDILRFKSAFSPEEPPKDPPKAEEDKELDGENLDEEDQGSAGPIDIEPDRGPNHDGGDDLSLNINHGDIGL